MDDLISRAAARNVIKAWGREENEAMRMTLLHTYLTAIPAVDAAPVVHGQWIRQNGSACVFKCSACRFKFAGAEIANYCPHCGAKMDGERRDSE